LEVIFKGKKMKTENWVRTETLSDYQKQALRLVEKRKLWEREQLKQGKREVRIPHPTVDKTFIIKFI